MGAAVRGGGLIEGAAAVKRKNAAACRNSIAKIIAANRQELRFRVGQENAVLGAGVMSAREDPDSLRRTYMPSRNSCPLHRHVSGTLVAKPS